MTTVNTAAATEAQLAELALTIGKDVKVRADYHFRVDRITAPNDFNLRIAPGMVVAGIRVDKDMRNIGGMADSIRQAGGITEPLVLSERSNGEYILCQGYRRYNATLMIQKEEPDSPLARKLETVPALIYKGLTPAQERNLVNDQKSKGFIALEVYRWFCSQLTGGHDWFTTARKIYAQIGQVTGGQASVQKIDAIQDKKEQDKELRKWLTSYVFQWWVSSWKAGPVLTNMSEHTYLFKEGGTTQRPHVVVDSMRMRTLWSAVDEDMKAGVHNRTEGGPRLKAEMAKMHTEDEGLYDPETGKRRNKSKTGPMLRPYKEVAEIISNVGGGMDKPNLMGRILKISLKDGGDAEAVQVVKGFDSCREAYNLHAAYIRPELKAVFDLLFLGTDGAADQFTAFLIDNYAPTETATEDNTATEGEPFGQVVDPEGLARSEERRAEEVPVPEMLPPVVSEPEAVQPEPEAVPEPAIEPEHADANGEFSLVDTGNPAPENLKQARKRKHHKAH